MISSKRNANINDDQLQSEVEERNEIIGTRTKGSMFRCKVTWAAYAEKSSTYFFALEKRKAAARVIPALFLNGIRDTGELSNSTEETLSECTALDEKLYKRVPREGLKIQSFLLGFVGES